MNNTAFMEFTEKDRGRFTRHFVLSFYCLAIYNLWNGMWLFQIEPHFFNTRFDGTTWLFMQTGIHQWLLDNRAGWILFDAFFYSMPLLYFLAYRRNSKLAAWMAGLMLIVNWIYVQCYTLYPSNSIEGHVGWLLFPLVFMTTRLKSYYFMVHGMRYFFLFFFFSAGCWKIIQGGLFNPEQMSGILLMQHKEYLVANPGSWYTNFIYWTINQSGTGYFLYIAATLAELSFVVGFFTRKYDRLLLLFFVSFLAADYFIMRIPYFSVMPMALTLLYSNRKK